MKDTRFIKTIRLRNLLSFGPDSEEIELRPLNVLIGPNASGKSNFIDAFGILRYLPWDIRVPFSSGGGFKEFIWKGENNDKVIEIEITGLPQFNRLRMYEENSIRYRIKFGLFGEYLNNIIEEIIEYEFPSNDEDFFYRYQNGKATIKKYEQALTVKNQMMHEFIPSKDFNPLQSILSQRKDPISYTEITNIGQKLGGIRLYRNFYVGINSPACLPQKADLRNDFLSENLNNFVLILNDLKDRRETKDLLKNKLKLFYQDFDSFRTVIQGGTVQLFIYEKGFTESIPMLRLSDGTIRYLCLLTILCHPEPPPLICIEEPEIGLHPDIMPTIADLLIEASKRTQLIVTTHSDILVSALSETPESVLVCEHDEAGSHLRRLDEKKLKVWLKDYSLGELWLKGEIGGNRW